ncbi:MAG: hypothetical protein D6696_12710 [Acidobacteria bacterium]|nr:MAG: hypothetical protein D6696_12710 [Acidobacteriota bacterium]
MPRPLGPPARPPQRDAGLRPPRHDMGNPLLVFLQRAVQLAPPELRRLEQLRSGARRAERADFELLERLHPRRPVQAARELVAAFQSWGGGGLAYLDGRDDEAARVLHQLVKNPRMLVALGPASPLVLLARDGTTFHDWELALAYGDARHLARSQLEGVLRLAPQEPRLLLAQAVADRLAGDERQAIEHARQAFETTADPVARAYAAQLLAAAYLHLGELGEAAHWHEEALVTAPSPYRGLVALEAAALASRRGQRDDARRLLNLACQEDVPFACQALRRPDRRR